jgi:hypothetical protein
VFELIGSFQEDRWRKDGEDGFNLMLEQCTTISFFAFGQNCMEVPPRKIVTPGLSHAHTDKDYL